MKCMINPHENQMTHDILPSYHKDWFDVSGGHKIYYELYGNKNGIPVVILHGGPGAGTSDKVKRFFDPKRYHVILFDQRGAGKSTPFAETAYNTTWELINDIEALRLMLKLEKWHVFGGSWGSTLALIYAIKFPQVVEHLWLRGIF